jgi:hypothetical protein
MEDPTKNGVEVPVVHHDVKTIRAHAEDPMGSLGKIMMTGLPDHQIGKDIQHPAGKEEVLMEDPAKNGVEVPGDRHTEDVPPHPDNRIDLHMIDPVPIGMTAVQTEMNNPVVHLLEDVPDQIAAAVRVPVIVDPHRGMEKRIGPFAQLNPDQGIAVGVDPPAVRVDHRQDPVGVVRNPADGKNKIKTEGDSHWGIQKGNANPIFGRECKDGLI